MRTFPNYPAALDCALRVQRLTGRKPRVQKVRCIGTRRPWLVSEARS